MTPLFSDEWKSFTRSIFINASQEKCFFAWRSAQALEAWFLETVIIKNNKGTKKSADASIQSGDLYTWKWHGWEHLHESYIIEVIEGKSIEFDFLKAGKVKLIFNPISAQRTELVLTQSDIPCETEADIRNYYYGCSLGWSFWLTNMKAWIEHGIILNEKTNPYKGDKRILNLVNQ